MIFELARNFHNALAAMPAAHSRRRTLLLLDEAIRRDIHFIDRHPITLFQCMWNTCWWYDCPDAAAHPTEPRGSGTTPDASGAGVGARGLYTFLTLWRSAREQAVPPSPWLRSLRPPRPRLGTAQEAVLKGHELDVVTVAYSPDGGRIVTGSRDWTVRIWDADDGATLAVLRGHEYAVQSAAWSPDGRRIASSGAYGDQTLRMWDSDSGRELSSVRGLDSPVQGLCFSPDGRWIAGGCHDSTVRVWDAQSGTQLLVLCGHEERVTSVSIRRDGRRIVSGSDDSTVRVWNTQDGAQLSVLRGHESVAYAGLGPDQATF